MVNIAGCYTAPRPRLQYDVQRSGSCAFVHRFTSPTPSSLLIHHPWEPHRQAAALPSCKPFSPSHYHHHDRRRHSYGRTPTSISLAHRFKVLQLPMDPRPPRHRHPLRHPTPTSLPRRMAYADIASLLGPDYCPLGRLLTHVSHAMSPVSERGGQSVKEGSPGDGVFE